MTTVDGALTIGSLFSGYGGLCELAVAPLLGGRVVWHCDIDPAASKVLAHHWPDTPNLGDITKADFSTVPAVQILTGGFPCTDVSNAGRQAGIRPGTRSGLWSVMRHATAVLRPELVLIENVRGLLHAPAHSDVEPCPWCLGDDRGVPALRALGAVLADLADLGYDAAWCGLPASAVGAPHTRYRIFIAAADTRRHPRPQDHADLGTAARRGRAVATDPDRVRHQRSGQARGRWVGPADGGDAAARGSVPAPAGWGEYEPAIRRWEHLTGQPAPVPTVPGRRGNAVLNPALPEWMMGLPAGHITAVSGLSRADMLRLAGNGVVPRQAAAALAHLLPLLGITTLALAPTAAA
ncbi:DNA cytosine methyltransferase [Amycolatopsis sp. NPDC026612]|uniref:DNA cytosine methyltransferase n=1 Tax=Amycolatopsis sp. NPDC026612 TaxID=3155466 RepID=UPI0033EA4336